MPFRIAAALLAACCCLPAVALAAATAPTVPTSAIAPLFTAPASTTADANLPPANTVVELELIDPVSSETSHKGDFFKLRVVQPVVVDGEELVPAGTIAVGQVVHAAKAGMGGKGGELLLAARYLELQTGQVKLRSSFGAAGQNHTVAAIVASQFLGPIALAVHGKHLDLPAGTRIAARIAPPTPVAAAPAAAADSNASPAAESSGPAAVAAPSSP